MQLKKVPKKEERTIDEISAHYKIEKEIASRLRSAPKEERKKLYPILYDELFMRVPHHPQLTRKVNLIAQRSRVAQQMKLLSKFLNPEDTFLELGSGDCSLSFEIAKRVKWVYSIDVSEEITKNIQQPSNFELILSEGSSVNVPPKSINIAFSNQLMEHLHPEDAVEQLEGIYNALVPGGIYICITPHRFNGPHDISKYFDDIATGFHIKEYTNSELYRLFKSVGFSKVQPYLYLKGNYVKFPIYPSIILECFVNLLPFYKKKLSTTIIFRNILTINLIATKPF